MVYFKGWVICQVDYQQVVSEVLCRPTLLFVFYGSSDRVKQCPSPVFQISSECHSICSFTIYHVGEMSFYSVVQAQCNNTQSVS